MGCVNLDFAVIPGLGLRQVVQDLSRQAAVLGVRVPHAANKREQAAKRGFRGAWASLRAPALWSTAHGRKPAPPQPPSSSPKRARTHTHTHTSAHTHTHTRTRRAHTHTHHKPPPPPTLSRTPPYPSIPIKDRMAAPSLVSQQFVHARACNGIHINLVLCLMRHGYDVAERVRAAVLSCTQRWGRGRAKVTWRRQAGKH